MADKPQFDPARPYRKGPELSQGRDVPWSLRNPSDSVQAMKDRGAESDWGVDDLITSLTPVGAGKAMLAAAPFIGKMAAKVEGAAARVPKVAKNLVELAENALDMSKAARMKRAQKMGFDTAATYYHGTRGDISQFAKEALGETTGAQSARKGFFFASEPGTAAQYAEISSSRPALRGATGVEDKFYADGPAALEYKRYLAERDLKSLQGNNRHMEKYLAEMPKNRQTWLDNIEAAKRPPEMGVRSDGSTYEKYRTPVETGYANLAKMEARAEEYKKALSKSGQKKMNQEIAAKQAELDEVTNYIQDAQGGQNVLPVHLRMKNPLVHDFKGEHYREVTYNELMQKAKKEGHDGVIFKNTFDPGHKNGDPDELPQDIVAVFSPSQIRSTNAAFDPKKKNSGNILAGTAAAATTAAALKPAFDPKKPYSPGDKER